MRIKKIHIRNFKSLVDFELENLKPFCAFVGPNASGKSNIFEALEFLNFLFFYGIKASNLFGTKEDLLSFFSDNKEVKYDIYFGDNLNINYGFMFSSLDSFDGIALVTTIFANKLSLSDYSNAEKRKHFIQEWEKENNIYERDYEQFIDSFSRIFVGNSKFVRINQQSSISSSLLSDASNLPQIIGQIFQDETKREDFIEWLRILIPEFKNIEVKKSNIDGSFEFFVYENASSKPFPRNLLSDGTKNILSLMAAVYQNNQPQFLCIEEPENGLHPEAVELLVDFFREKCETEGHHIWLNTHSPTLVRCMEIDEVVLVNKINGQTRARKIDVADNINIKTDEAWLSNALGGGVSWSK